VIAVRLAISSCTIANAPSTWQITLPVRLIPELRRATRHDVRTVEILGRGGGLRWERLDLDLSVPGLLSSMFAGPE